MNLILRIPDAIAARLGSNSAELEREALEALVLQKLRDGLLSKDELAEVLGLADGEQVDGFLKTHDVFEPCTADDVDRDVATLARLGF